MQPPLREQRHLPGPLRVPVPRQLGGRPVPDPEGAAGQEVLQQAAHAQELKDFL